MNLGMPIIILARWRFAANATTPQGIAKRIIFVMMMESHIAETAQSARE
jgi:hypothetical protein